MPSKTIVILGATGNIGHYLVKELTKRGHKVKALGRNQDKLNELKSDGVETIVAGDFTNEETLTKAFKGADAVFSFIPPGYATDNYETYQDKVGETIKNALQKSNIKYVVNLSSIGAQLSKGTGPIKGLHRHEQRLKALSNINIIHLRPGYFMENLLMAIPVIRQKGVLGSPLRENLSIPMIATKDIAAKAAEFLDRLDFKGHTVFEFVGPKFYTLTEATKTLGKAIGKKDLKYEQVSYEDAERGMIAVGMKPASAKLMIEMYKAFNDKEIPNTQQLSSDHQGKTTLDQFASEFAQKFSSAETERLAHKH